MSKTSNVTATLTDERKAELATAVATAAIALDGQSGELSKVIMRAGIEAGPGFEGVIIVAREQARAKSESAASLVNAYASMWRTVAHAIRLELIDTPKVTSSLRKAYNEARPLVAEAAKKDADAVPDAGKRQGGRKPRPATKAAKDTESAAPATEPQTGTIPQPKTMEEVVKAIETVTRYATDALPASDSRTGDLLRIITKFRRDFAAACAKHELRM